MMIGSKKIEVRAAVTPDDIAAVMALRRARFGVGADAFDQGAVQMLVMGDRPLCSFRLTVFGADLTGSYSGQFYDLAQLRLGRPSVELGRLCLADGAGHDALRAAFAGMTQLVDAHGAGLLFGCASFPGAEAERHVPALSVLRAYQAPQGFTVMKKSSQVVDYMPLNSPATAQGMRDMPPLLRSYLALGGWVSDHAVQDFDLDTLHVFTGVEVAKIPPARAASLRALL